MACLPVFSSLRRRKSPLLGAFFAPGDLSDLGLVQALASVSADVVAASAAKPSVPFQRRNARSLVRKVKIFLVLFEYLREAAPAGAAPMPSPATLCFKELYILLHRARILLDYCAQSSRLWLLLQNAQISGHFLQTAPTAFASTIPSSVTNAGPTLSSPGWGVSPALECDVEGGFGCRC